MRDPEVGDFAAWPVSMPGPDIDYALCIERTDDSAKLRFQPWQQPGPWREAWCAVYSANTYGCWVTDRIENIGPALKAERTRFLKDYSQSRAEHKEARE